MAAQASSHQKSSQSHGHNFLETVKEKTKPAQAFIAKFNNDWSMNFAGLLAYNLLTAILPIAIALFGILGLILGQDSSLVQGLLNQIPKLFPVVAQQQAIANLLKGAISQIQKDAGILVIIAILLSLFGGSRLFITLEGCLDIVYRVRPRTIIRQNIMAFSMLLIFIVLVPIMFFTSTAPAFILNFLNSIPQLKAIPFFSAFTNNFITTYLTSLIASVIVGFILFEAIYVVVPNQKISWKHSWLGALVASVLLVLFLQLFPYYTSNFLKGYSGAIGLAVIILLFFYYFAVILMLGAQVNAFFSEKVQPIPNDLVTFVSTMAGELNKDRPASEDKPHANPKPTHEKDDRHVEEASNKIDKDRGQKASADQSQNEQQPAQGQQDRQFSSEQPCEGSVATASEMHQQVQTERPRSSSSKTMAALGVVFGSILTVMVETLRLRNHGK